LNPGRRCGVGNRSAAIGLLMLASINGPCCSVQQCL
jgi:hypothetical protein